MGLAHLPRIFMYVFTLSIAVFAIEIIGRIVGA